MYEYHFSDIVRERKHADHLDTRKIPAAEGIYEKKSSLFHIMRQFYSFLGGCLTYLTIQLYFGGVQTRRMLNPLHATVEFFFRTLRYLCYYRQYKGMENNFFICH